MTTKRQDSQAARALGKRAAGKPKVYTADELARRTERLKVARGKRWANRPADRGGSKGQS